MAAATATILRLGAWFPSGDSFGAHSASPTGSIIDLNDGITFSLLDGSTGEGDGLDWGTPTPNVLSSGNVRTTGKAVKARRYTENRTVKATMFWGQGASYATWISAIHNIVGLCEGITAEKPAALQVQVTGASTPLYLDVLEAHVEVPYNEVLWQQLVETHVICTFTCKPHFRGPITTLQNLVVNPGFEAPSGPGVVVFSDAFANLNAYTTQSGSAPTADKAFYSDAVQADAAIRYYRLDEASGTVATDAANGQNGTYIGGYTLGVTGALTGDSDTAITLNGTTGYVAMSVGSPMIAGNGAFSHEAWIKFAANPAGAQIFFHAGANGSSNNSFQMYLATTGKVFAGFFGMPGISSTAALSTATWHHVVSTWDGTTQLLYIDGTVQTATATPGAANQSATFYQIGAQNNAGSIANFWSGQLDEVATYASTLSPARISAHYTVGTTTPAVATNTLLLVANSSVSFGSPNWTAINTWRFRFRWSSGATLYAYYHYTDANSSLRAEVTATQIVLKHTIAGVTTTLVTTTTGTTLATGVHYWLSLTQFPSLLGNQTGNMPPQIQAVLAYDVANAIGTTVAAAGPVATTDAMTALQGGPRLGTTTGPIAFGIPNSTTATHTVSLFGPGGWTRASTGTGAAAAAWEQQQLTSATNTGLYTGGPVTSLGAGRIDVALNGTLNAQWICGDASSAARVLVTSPQSFTGTIKAALKSTGVANSCTQAILVNEYDVSGNFLRTQTIASTTGAQSSYLVLSGTYTLGASASYCQIVLSAVDATSGSAGGTIWWDNVQAWSSSNGATMAYCELFFPQAPAQLVVAGIVGDVPAPASLSLNTYLTTLANGSSLSVVVGRRTNSTKGMTMIGAALGATSGVGAWTYTLDGTAYGGYTISSSNLAISSAWGLWTRSNDPTFPNLVVGQGTYHLYTRAQTAASGANTAKVAIVPLIAKLYSFVFGVASNGFNGYLAYWTGPALPPFSVAATWTLCDAGQVQLPPFPRGTLFQGGEVISATTTWSDASASAGTQNWLALLPVDGSILAATVLQYSGSTLLNQFMSINNDGVGVQVGYPAVWTTSGTLSFISGIAGPGNFIGEGGPGTSSAATVSVNSTADAYLTLDPALLGGVNQIAAVLTDNVATVLPLYATITYMPLYNYPI